MKRDHSGAEAAFVKAIELNPNDVRAYSWLAVAYGRVDRADEAFVILQKALQLNPMSGELNTTMGRLQYDRSGWDWDSAFKYFERAMQRDPDYSGSYNAVGLHYYATGQLDQAIPYIRKLIDLKDRPITKVGGSHVVLADIYVNIGDYDSAANLIREMREIESDHRGATKVEIHLQLARRNFSAARGLVHSALSKHIGIDGVMSLMAFYEMVIGDTIHAEEIYTHLAAESAIANSLGEVILYTSSELGSGMMGAVNLAHLHNRNGDTLAAHELLVKAREYIESRDHPWFVHGIAYVHAQIAAIEGNNDAAIEYVREAVEAGWTKAWFGRIDPIMADLRKDARYTQILEELEEKLLEMREHPKMLASNEP
jgi:tetratricopeptide (TPR) repeat protein